MSTDDYSMAFSEALDVLQHSEIEVIEKIPLKIIKKLKEKSSSEYVSQIDYDTDFTISDKASAILAVIYQDFLCDDQEELEEFNQELLKNEEKYQKELREKYNPDIFKNKRTDKTSSVAYNMQMVEYKESLITKIINKIKNIFSKK